VSPWLLRSLHGSSQVRTRVRFFKYLLELMSTKFCQSSRGFSGKFANAVMVSYQAATSIEDLNWTGPQCYRKRGGATNRKDSSCWTRRNRNCTTWYGPVSGTRI
jgi:hypothetical protein